MCEGICKSERELGRENVGVGGLREQYGLISTERIICASWEGGWRGKESQRG